MFFFGKFWYSNIIQASDKMFKENYFILSKFHSYLVLTD